MGIRYYLQHPDWTVPDHSQPHVLTCTPMVAMFTWYKAFNSLIKVCDIWLLRTQVQAEIGREEQDMLLAGIAVFPPTGNGGWISGNKDWKLSSPSLLDYGTILCKCMVSFLSILWSLWRKDVARSLCPNNFSKWKASDYSGNWMAALLLDLREATGHGLSYYFSCVLQSHQGNIARSQPFLLTGTQESGD